MAVAVDLAERGERTGGRWRYGSIPDAPDENRSSSTSWQQAMRFAGVVLDHAAELADQVLAGDMALDAVSSPLMTCSAMSGSSRFRRAT